MMILNYESDMVEILEQAQSFDLFVEGEVQNIPKDSEKFNKIFEFVNSIFTKGKVMPAFGVSLHHETLYALNSNVWLQINFESEMNKAGLPFSSLLFKVEETYGMNLIRKNFNRYDGRCIYLAFDEQVDVQAFLQNI